eukprot:TRINITY_DN393_c0_g1_i1.p1 TRINITY_DN393_c0_g1~~TRINITY_DN393_c0_g1_i1.p1  ORF type:complete len:392 (+),score=85.11 TRINITY_DN393_c0_g1_i1:191-1366(+)
MRGNNQETDSKPTRECTGCEGELPRAEFSRTQWLKGVGASRCARCVHGPIQRKVNTTRKRSSSLLKVQLFFDGACSGNPGPGAWGGWCEIQGRKHEQASRLGAHTTSNQAEYAGLIGGLRMVLRELDVPPEGVALCVHGDSELVIKQMTGEYKLWEPTLKLYHSTAVGLVNRFGMVSYVALPREKNRLADKLAARALAAAVDTNLLFRPNLCGISGVKIGKHTAAASNDVGAVGAVGSYIDAGFLASLPGGEQMLQGLLEPPSDVVVAKVDMTVLGVLSELNCEVCWDITHYPEMVTPELVYQNVIVVVALPVPMHLHTSNDPAHPHAFTQVKFDSNSKLAPGCFEEKYQSSPWWASDVDIFPGCVFQDGLMRRIGPAQNQQCQGAPADVA